MKLITDDEYVGFGYLVYDEPLDLGSAEIEALRQKGYKR